MIYSYKNIELELKGIDKKSGIVTGYFASFGTKDADGDIIHPGAFLRSIQEWGPEGKGRVKHLMNHDPGKPLGVITMLKEDQTGLYYESKVGSHNLGQDFIKMAESGLIREHSIGYNDLTPKDKQKGDDANNITDVKLYEGSSLTAWGANEYTPLVEMKGKTVEDISFRIKAFEKFVRDTDATDETIENCLIYIKQLGQIIEMMTSTQSAGAVEQQKQEEVIRPITITNSFEEWKKNFKMH